MAIRHWLIALAMGCILVGCQSRSHRDGPPSGASTLVCPGASCDAVVTVENCVVSVEPQVLDLRQGPATQTLRWELRTPGYTFSTNPMNWAIVIKDPPNTHGQFTPSSPNPTRVIVQFKKRTPGLVHTYGVNVIRDDGQTCSTPDPWVWE